MKTFHIVAAAGISVAGLSAAFLFYLYKRRKHNTPPKDGWQYAGTLEEIIMFPIKSCSGIELTDVICDKNGIKFGQFEDRKFMLLNENDEIVFAGNRPEMWKIKAELITHDELEVTAPNMEPLLINITWVTQNRQEVVKCFGGSCLPLIECDSMYGRWFSKFLLKKDTGLRLFVCINPRKIPFRKNLDCNPYMVIVDKSVKDLNDRIANPVHHWQFRGNFLIKSILPAYAEDNWKWMRIGNDATFRYKAPCYRCILPNINPFTSERSSDFEPLRTLKRYRMKPGQIEPEMGIYFSLYKEGMVMLGDAVFVST